MANLGADENEQDEPDEEEITRMRSMRDDYPVRERVPRRGTSGKPKRRGKASTSLNPFVRAQETLSRATSRITDEHKRLFSEDEADERRQDTADMLQRWSDNLDEFLTISAMQVEKDASGKTITCDIWGLEDDEANALAGSWLKRAKRSEQAAALLRLSLEGDDDLQSLIVLGPRLWKSASWYPDHGGLKLVQWQRK